MAFRWIGTEQFDDFVRQFLWIGTEIHIVTAARRYVSRTVDNLHAIYLVYWVTVWGIDDTAKLASLAQDRPNGIESVFFGAIPHKVVGLGIEMTTLK